MLLAIIEPVAVPLPDSQSRQSGDQGSCKEHPEALHSQLISEGPALESPMANMVCLELE